MDLDFMMKRPGVVLAVALLAIGFGLWSLYAASRYQALCELSYWTASDAELKQCDERLAELKTR